MVFFKNKSNEEKKILKFIFSKCFERYEKVFKTSISFYYILIGVLISTILRFSIFFTEYKKIYKWFPYFYFLAISIFIIFFRRDKEKMNKYLLIALYVYLGYITFNFIYPIIERFIY